MTLQYNRGLVDRNNSFTSRFLATTGEVIKAISIEEIEDVIHLLAITREEGGRLFLAGSGGGAGHASHAACDFRKLCALEAYCITDNISELTARTNDEGWNTSYANWLAASKISKNDCLFVFSVGGGSIEPPVSMNLVLAVEAARSVGSKIVGVVGRDGGVIRQIADSTILIPPVSPDDVTPQTEGLQAVIWHLLVSHPQLAANRAKWESLSPVIR